MTPYQPQPRRPPPSSSEPPHTHALCFALQTNPTTVLTPAGEGTAWSYKFVIEFFDSLNILVQRLLKLKSRVNVIAIFCNSKGFLQTWVCWYHLFQVHSTICYWHSFSLSVQSILAKFWLNICHLNVRTWGVCKGPVGLYRTVLWVLIFLHHW